MQIRDVYEYQHFLVSVDFSQSANQALDDAIVLAKKLKARLSLLHVIHIVPMGATGMGSALPMSYLEDGEADLRRSMEGYRMRVQEAGLEGDIAIVPWVTPRRDLPDYASQKH
jgi:nucleotide-binding universal stress UspA family protein